MVCKNCKALRSDDPKNDGAYCGVCGEELYVIKKSVSWSKEKIDKFNKDNFEK